MKLLHRLHLAGAGAAHRRFLAAVADPEAAQRAVLARTLDELAHVPRWRHLAGASWERFTAQAPLTTWDDVSADLDAQRRDGRVRAAPPARRWQPTSGSTAARKWLPYPPSLLSAFDEAAGAWLIDLAQSCPAAFAGRHYWSLSWLPDDLRREGADSDDRSLLSPLKRVALGRLMAVPPQVAELGDADAALLATAASLAATTDLSLISVWSPTFALALLATLARHRKEVATWLARGRWPFPLPLPRAPTAAEALAAWDGAPSHGITAALWPRLALVSAWDGAASLAYAADLTALTPHALFQGKGLWATEGVVTIPFAGHWPLALTSHVVELRCLATGRVLAPWAVAPGQLVQPLLTTTGGLVRHALADRLEVTEPLGRAPCLRFCGRLDGTDLVGEKLDRAAVEALVAPLAARCGAAHATLWAVTRPPHYVLVAEVAAERQAELGRARAAALVALHHYRLARELGQLGAAEVVAVADALAVGLEVAARAGRGAGEWKAESLAPWPLVEGPAELAAALAAAG